METETKKREIMVGLWQTGRKGFCVSHKKGLDQEQVDMLRSLKVGDRIKMWISDESPVANRPNYRLGKLEDKENGQ